MAGKINYVVFWADTVESGRGCKYECRYNNRTVFSEESETVLRLIFE
jgi:hypothetical protein